MSLSPSGREGLLSSCPTGGGQGRSLMTLMSTGASSSREKRDRQGQGQRQRQRQREAEVETPKPRARTQDSLERRRVRAEAGAASEWGTGLSAGRQSNTDHIRVAWSKGGTLRWQKAGCRVLLRQPCGSPSFDLSHKPSGPRETRKGGKEG